MAEQSTDFGVDMQRLLGELHDQARHQARQQRQMYIDHVPNNEPLYSNVPGAPGYRDVHRTPIVHADDQPQYSGAPLQPPYIPVPLEATYVEPHPARDPAPLYQDDRYRRALSFHRFRSILTRMRTRVNEEIEGVNLERAAVALIQVQTNTMIPTRNNEVAEGLPSLGMQAFLEGLQDIPVNQQHIDSCTQCSICFEDLSLDEAVIELPVCRHIFHSSCVREWFKQRGTCPLCRQNPRSTSNRSA